MHPPASDFHIYFLLISSLSPSLFIHTMKPSTALFLFSVTLLSFTQAFEPAFHIFPYLQKFQKFGIQETPPAEPLATSDYPEYNFSVPVDHFHNESRYAPHSNDFFNLRYWFDARHYQEGGPVFVIAAGEGDGTARFPFLSKGIISQLAKTYHGIGVILEHRYYGKSFPVENLTTENIRFLSTDQAIADYAYFASHIVFPGLEHLNLTAPRVPWIAYGGSYAGAFVAFLRKLYPDTYWGAVSSSGVTKAIEDYWEYMEPIRQFAPSDCVTSQQTFIDIVDKILIDHASNKTVKKQLKSAFGLNSQLPLNDTDFAALLTSPLGSFQARNWDPEVGSGDFKQYCANITSSDLLYPDTAAAVGSSVKELVGVAGYDAANSSLVTGMLNYAGYFNKTLFSDLQPPSPVSSVALSSPETLRRSSSVSWGYQVCTEWGYFQIGASVPSDILPLVSRLVDLPYASAFCAEDFNITTPPNTDIINKHGGFNFSYPRVAIIDGLADPWRMATPHADVAPARQSTDDEPFLMLDLAAEDVWDGMRGAVHHWDQNGLSDKQSKEAKRAPQAIVDIHEEVVRFVGVWLGQWKSSNWLPHIKDNQHGQQVMGV